MIPILRGHRLDEAGGSEMIRLGMLDVLKQVDTDEDGTKTVTYWGLTRGESIAVENAESAANCLASLELFNELGEAAWWSLCEAVVEERANQVFDRILPEGLKKQLGEAYRQHEESCDQAAATDTDEE